MNLEKHVAIACSYKFEDLNVLLEILKLNFKNPPITHVFCNLNSRDFEKHKNIIDYSLIDSFYHIPDEKCYVGNLDRDTKRRQPLEMFSFITLQMSKIQKNFIFLEGDVYPLNEISFFSPLENLEKDSIFANLFYFDKIDISKFDRIDHKEAITTSASQMHKMPNGYILPAPMYIGYQAAKMMSEDINQYYHSLLDGKKNFEGCLGTIISRKSIKRNNFSNYFCYTYPHLNQVDPVVLVLHHHNILNLKKIFKNLELKGEMINFIKQNKEYTKKVEGIKLSYEDINFEICKLHIPADL